MSRSFDDQHDLAAPPTAIRWDLGEEPVQRRSTHKVCAVRFGMRLIGVADRYVRGLREVHAVTPIPLAPPSIVGLAAIDGAILPLVDLTAALGLPALPPGPPWTALLVEAAGFTVLLAAEDVVAFEPVGDRDDGGETPMERPLAYTAGSAPVLGRPIPLLDLPTLLQELRPAP